MFIYIYIMLFLILSLFISRKLSFNMKCIIFIVFSIYIGLRKEIGSDWYQYLSYYYRISSSSLKDVFLISDPGYVLLNSFSSMVGGEIYLVNLISAIIFLYGLFVFIKQFNLKLSLSLFIVYPYLITVVSMGYTRQSIAIGFFMLVLSELKNKNKQKASIFFILGILFHKTLILGFIFFIDTFSFIWIIFGMFLFLFVYILFSNVINHMYINYFLYHMQSSGGIIRILLLLIISFIFYIYSKKWKKYYFNEYYLIRKMVILSVLFFMFMIITKATTLFDRISLYLYPLQIIVLNRIFNLERDKYLRLLFFVWIITLYLLLFFIWLTYATHNYFWIPYNNILFLM